jgi:hypothetical protein
MLVAILVASGLSAIELQAQAPRMAQVQQVRPGVVRLNAPEEASPEVLPPAPPTVTAAVDSLIETVPIEGTLAVAPVAQYAPDPKQASELVVLSAVPHGQAVKKGDVILRLDSEKIEDAIEVAKRTEGEKTLALGEAKLELEFTQRESLIAAALAERALTQAQDDLKRFTDVTLPLEKQSAEFSVKSAENSLKYNLEELKQLEQMYREDDLTEETEEIILERARNSVEQAKFMLLRTQNSADESTKVTLPRRQESLQDAVQKAEIELAKQQATGRIQLAKLGLAVAKAEADLKESQEKLAELQSDLEKMIVLAPADGWLYYGRHVNGDWPQREALKSKLQPGGRLTAREVVFSIVKAGPYEVFGTVKPEVFAQLKPGQVGRLTVPGTEGAFGATIAEIQPVPTSSGEFVVRMKALDLENPSVLPGRAAKVEVAVQEAKDVVTLPKVAVESEGEKHFVTIVNPDGGSERREVTTGIAQGDSIEIKEGVAAGDQVLLPTPAAQETEQ